MNRKKSFRGTRGSSVRRGRFRPTSDTKVGGNLQDRYYEVEGVKVLDGWEVILGHRSGTSNSNL